MAYYNKAGTRVYDVNDLIKFARTNAFGQFNEAVYHALIHLKNLQLENAELKQELQALDDGFEEVNLGEEAKS
jgi:hypothetical protein